jgi:epoxyqueuosine reductase
MIEKDLKSIAMRKGAIRVGIARREMFGDAPPSADMTYVKPWAEAIISFAVPLGTEWIEDYLGKRTRMVFKKRVFDTYHRVYRIGAAIEECLKTAGFRAYNVIPNGTYRPDHTFEKAIPDPDTKPPLSLRYMAVGAGVGALGWSGNVLVPGAWSNVYLGGVLTNASLSPDGPLEEDLCNQCRVCTSVCPVNFIDRTEATPVTIAGREHLHNKKHGDLRCVISCGGYTGLSPDGKWSSWSTGRTILPEDDSLLPSLYMQLRDDPECAMARRNLTFGARGVLDRSLENTNPTCNHCITVCSGPLERRKYLRELLHRSGTVRRNHQGYEIVVKAR